MKWILFLLLILLFINSCSNEVAFRVDEDVIVILSPVDKEEVSGIIIVNGLSSNLEYIELQVDLKGWNKVYGVDDWYYSLDTKNLDNGDHVIYVRGFDGNKFTKVKAVRINVKN